MSDVLYMLDTNTASYLIKGQFDNIQSRIRSIPMASICISAITEAELLRGVSKVPESKSLPIVVNEFLLRVESLPWDSHVAAVYGRLRTDCENEGKPLGNMDMLIAAHSLAVGAVLVTNDKAFYNLEHYLKLEDWTKFQSH